MRNIIRILKGGEGSGNFGHEGRPGERGGSQAEGGAAEKKNKLTRKKILNDVRSLDERMRDKKYIEKLKNTHGLTLNAKGASDTAIFSAHETLATMPPGALKFMQKSGTEINILDENDHKPPTFKVGNQTFVEGGHASYPGYIGGTPEITVYSNRNLSFPVSGTSKIEYDKVSDVLAHEAGHFGINALLTIAAKESSELKSLRSQKDNLKDERRDFARVHGGDSPKVKELDDQITAIDKRAREIDLKGVQRKLKNFDIATKKEGCSTSYAESYRGTAKGNNPDKMIYGSQMDGSAQITRTANENFAEITSGLYSRRNVFYEHKSQFLKESYKKTYKQYKGLERVLRNTDKIIIGGFRA